MTTQEATSLEVNPTGTGQPAPTVPPALAGRGLFRTTTTILVAFALLTALATNQLFILSAHTKSLFAWTIQPPLSAAFVGGGYAAGFALVVLAARSRAWADARLSVSTIWLFATLTLVATLSHLDEFHFHADGTVAKFAAWFWLGIYIVVPVALLVTIVRQCRAVGSDAPRRQLLPAWLTAILGAQGLLILAIGVALFAHPASAATIWPWHLTPLTAQMIAAWLIAFGVAALHAVADRDLLRLRIAALGYAVFGGCQLAAVIRFRGELHWNAAPAPVYVVVLTAVTVTGLEGWRLTMNRPTRRPT